MPETYLTDKLRVRKRRLKRVYKTVKFAEQNIRDSHKDLDKLI